MHEYLSTACHHELHERCRLHCKFCAVPCGCACHARATKLAGQFLPITREAQRLAARPNPNASPAPAAP